MRSQAIGSMRRCHGMARRCTYRQLAATPAVPVPQPQLKPEQRRRPELFVAAGTRTARTCCELSGLPDERAQNALSRPPAGACDWYFGRQIIGSEAPSKMKEDSTRWYAVVQPGRGGPERRGVTTTCTGGGRCSEWGLPSQHARKNPGESQTELVRSAFGSLWTSAVGDPLDDVGQRS